MAISLRTDPPLLFHIGSASLRLLIVEKHLGLFAAFRMKEKIEGRVPVRTNCEIAEAALGGDRVRPCVTRADGMASKRSFDHVVAATGYRVDINRLEFLDKALRSEIACVKNTPILSTRFQSSAPGLFFVGLVAANSFGPMLRFA
jgi:hypothetical protein